MRLSKTQVCLYIYTELLNGRNVSLKEITNKFSIGSLAVFRDIQEIRAFLANNYSSYSIRYNKSLDVYELVKDPFGKSE